MHSLQEQLSNAAIETQRITVEAHKEVIKLTGSQF